MNAEEEGRDRERVRRMEDTEHWPLGGRVGLCDALLDDKKTPCANKGNYQPRMLVAAQGYPFKEGAPATLSMVIGLKVCREHRRGPEFYATAEGMKQIEDKLQEARPGAAPLDWGHVEMRHDLLALEGPDD